MRMKYTELKKRYWGGNLWEIGQGAWSTGNITVYMVQQFLNNLKDDPNGVQNFILE